MTVTEKTFNLTASNTNEIELPTSAYRRYCIVGVDYLHVEFQPARMKNIVEKPSQTRYFTLRPKNQHRTINLVTEKENKVKRMMIRYLI